MDAKMVDILAVAKNTEKKAQLKERGLTVSNLLIRAQRMQEEVVKDVDYHKHNGVVWKADRERWGQKRWETEAECTEDVARLASLRDRVLEASRACDKVMRFDLSFDEVCSALEKTAIELETAAAD